MKHYMKKTLTLLGILLLLHMTFVRPASALDPDKRAHLLGSTALGLGIDTLFYHYSTEMGPGQRMAASAGLALIPGIGIEIGDEFSPGTKFSWKDLTADAVGAVTGAIAGDLINGQFWISASGRQIRLIGRW